MFKYRIIINPLFIIYAYAMRKKMCLDPMWDCTCTSDNNMYTDALYWTNLKELVVNF